MEIFLQPSIFHLLILYLKNLKFHTDLESFIYLVKNPSHNLEGDFRFTKKIGMFE